MLRITNKRKEGKSLPAGKRRAVVLPLHAPNRSLDFLIELIAQVRPEKARDIGQATLRFKALLYQISQEKSSVSSLRRALLNQFLKTNIVIALTENGIVSSRGSWQELLSKIKHKVLPELQPPGNFLFVINKVFHKKTDHFWVKGVDKELWAQLFEGLGLRLNLVEPGLIHQLREALQVLSYRITTVGLEKEITLRYGNPDDAVFPFLEQNRLVNEYLQLCRSNPHPALQSILLANITEALHNCNQSIQWIREQRIAYGTSLSQTYILTRLQQLIDRQFMVLDLLDPDIYFNFERFVEYFKTVVQTENRKNSIREFLSEKACYLAHQIAEHGGRTGEKFISTTRREFWKMFQSAMGGGIIISFISISKNLLGKMALAPFWLGFLHSANYSLGFILIKDTGSTLATMQPAFTTNKLASSLDAQNIGEEPDLRNLAITVAKVSRTQLASFAGNLLLIFPLTYFLAWLFFTSTGTMIATGEAARKLLTDQQPFHTPALLWACLTGFFMFLSGLIAGYVENYLVYGKIGERLRSLRVFKRNLCEKRRYAAIHYLETNFGSLVGNVSLGFFLGMTVFFGNAFGLPVDIRHITLSVADTAIGFFGLNNHVSSSETWNTLFGLAAIGFLNFAVSFGMVFIVVVKSRDMRLRNYPEFAGLIWKYLRKYPKDFVKAPRTRIAAHLD